MLGPKNCGPKKLRPKKFGQNWVSKSRDIPGQMFPWQLASVKDGPRNLPLMLCQNWVSISWDIPDIDKCQQRSQKNLGLKHFCVKKNFGLKKLRPPSNWIKILSATSELFMIWEKVVRTNMAWTNVTVTVKSVQDGSRKNWD